MTPMIGLEGTGAQGEASGATQDDTPGFLAPSVQDQLEAVQVCRTVYGGSLELRRHPEFLPAFEKEKAEAHQARLEAALAIGAFKKTARSLRALVFRRAIEIGTDVPLLIRGDMDEEGGTEPGILENIDMAGQHLDLFAQGLFIDKLIDGHALILVDWYGPDGARRRSVEREARARPYWTLIRKGQVRRPYVRRDQGALVLESFAYVDDDMERQGTFAQHRIKRMRQFDLVDGSMSPFPPDRTLPPEKERRVCFRSWVQRKDGGAWEPEEEGRLLGQRMTRIPIAVDYADRTGFMRSDPPLLDVALEVIEHMQVRSDRKVGMHVTNVPLLQTFGIKPSELAVVQVGAAMGLAFEGSRQDQGAEYAEAQGYGLEEARQELQDIEKRIAQLGLSMLQRQSRAAETAEAERLHQKAQDSELAAYARATEDALEEALQLSAMWLGEPDGGSVAVNTEFEDLVMSPEQAKVYLEAVGEGRLSTEQMWDSWVAGKYLPKTFDPELEKERIQAEGAKELAAVAEALRRERQQRTAEEGEGGE